MRTATVSLASVVLGLLVTGCPDKNVEKEEPAEPAARVLPKAAARNGADDKAAEEDHGEDPEEHAADEGKAEKLPPKHRANKKEQAGEDKDQGGW
jgi:hypothetical protein